LATIFQKTGQILINTFKATTEAITSLRYQSDWWSGKSLVRLKRTVHFATVHLRQVCLP